MMTSAETRRATMALCGAFLAAALAFAWLAERRAPVAAAPTATAVTETPGATAYSTRCAACHAADAIAQLIRDAPDRPAKVREIGAKLVRHGDASGDEIAQILAFLNARASR
jgi:mono/diheme cytochrome c family protein